MTGKGEHILKSLELAGELEGDLTDSIYKALFESQPELEQLFFMDKDYAVRGSMLQHTFDCILDYAGEQTIIPTFISTSRYLHDEYGVPDQKFDDFFVVVKQRCKSILGKQWTADMEREWDAMLTDFATMV